MKVQRSWAELRRFPLAVVLATTCSFAVCSMTAPCAAQSASDLDRARDLFREGVSLEAAGNWAGALAKFEEVGRVKLTPQVRFHIARCKEQLGRLNEALGEYRLAEYEAGQQHIGELEAITQAREQLEARVPTVTITRGAGAELARVTLDGVELGEKQIGTKISLDPGPHTITARLPGDVQFQQNVAVQERESKTVELVPPPDLARKSEPEPTTAATNAKPEKSAAEEGDNGGPGAVPWIVGGVGVASLAASGIFLILRNGALSDLDKVCHGSICPDTKSARDSQDKGELYSTLSTVTFAVGVVGIGTAAVLLLTSGPSDATAEKAALNVDVRGSTTGGGVTVRGAF